MTETHNRNAFIGGGHDFSFLIFSFFSLVLHLVTVTIGFITGPYRGCTGSPAPPGCHINISHYLKVCCVSQYSAELGGDSRRQAVSLG